MHDENTVDKTFFFFDDDIPDSIIKNFKHHTKFYTPTSAFMQMLFVLKLRYLANTKYRFIKQTEIYGQDNLLITSPLIGKQKMNLIEDGLANYTRLPKERKHKLFKRIIGGPLMAQETLGYSTCVKRIYMTGMAPIPDTLKPKAILINLEELWDKSSVEKKNSIISCFNLTNSIIDNFRKCNSVLITQPLSEDNVITEEEKTELYRQIIKDKNIAIKPHPRERTNYKKCFPQAQILESHVPIELLSLIGVRFTDIYTIFSTAAMQFAGNPRIHFMGTKVHPALVERFGDVSYENGRIVSNAINN